LEFEWDDVKAAINLLKHKISFMQAKEVFNDPHATRISADPGEDGEERWLKTGTIEDVVSVITVVYTVRNNGKTIRLISARPAKKKEEKAYDDNKMQTR